MQGMQLCKEFYLEYGKPMLEQQFPHLLDKIAVGLVGGGSECSGWDDEVSRDHDFEPGFCIFLPEEAVVDSKQEFQLERAYAKLPKTYQGVSRGGLSPVGGNRRGVLRIADFLEEKIGSRDGSLSTEQWLMLPEYALREATNGELFFDGSGCMTALRQQLSGMPEDVRLKKLAGNLLLMAQSGQYNFMRCIKRGETGAAQLAAFAFANAAISVFFLLNRQYQPYYKWAFRALRELPMFAPEADTLEFLLSTPNDAENAEEKYYAMEDTAAVVISVLQDQDLTKAVCGDLEKHAYSVNDHIADAALRNRNVLCAV